MYNSRQKNYAALLWLIFIEKNTNLPRHGCRIYQNGINEMQSTQICIFEI